MRGRGIEALRRQDRRRASLPRTEFFSLEILTNLFVGLCYSCFPKDYARNYNHNGIGLILSAVRVMNDIQQ